jgi:hypothetical protein
MALLHTVLHNELIVAVQRGNAFCILRTFKLVSDHNQKLDS